jgi:hypothetical protein
MITETQSTFKRDGSYANQFDEFGNLVIVDSTEKYLSVTLTREVYENTSVSNIYTVDIEEFKDIPVKEDAVVSTLKSEKTKLQSQIDTLTSELSNMANSSGKDALISASKDIIIGLRIKAGEGKLPSDFNTVFPYLPLKSSEAVQSDASSTGLGSGTANNSTTVTNNSSTQSTTLVGAQKGLIPSPQQCVRQADIQFSPPLEFVTYLPPAPVPPPPPPSVLPAQQLSIIQTAKVVSTTPVSSVNILKLVEEQYVKCGGFVTNKKFSKGRYVIYVDLGTDIGEVTFNSDARGVPDRFIVEWDNNIVADTGYRGDDTLYSNDLKNALQQDGLPDAKILGKGASTITFQKTKSTPSVATVTVLAPINGTGWEFTMRCPVSIQPTIMNVQAVTPNEDCVNPTTIFKFAGNVDHTLRITLRGTSVTYSNEQYHGTLPRTVSEFSNNGVGPYNTNLSIKWTGRGSVQISQQPNSSNNYTAIIDIFDGKGGEGTYNLEVLQLKCSQPITVRKALNESNQTAYGVTASSLSSASGGGRNQFFGGGPNIQITRLR